MAKLKVTTYPVYTIELTQVELNVLESLTGSVTGNPKDTARVITDKIYELVSPHGDAEMLFKNREAIPLHKDNTILKENQ
jgi:hypothetical protein